MKANDFNFYNDIQELSEQKNRKIFLMGHAKILKLVQKEQMAIGRIKEFLKLCKNKKLTPTISFSGGKDSCVLRHLIHRVDKTIKCETAAELFHPDIAKFLKTIPDTTIISPIQNFE
jgi:3'-phosphoadenosine 5'-phosphosulfate sulfotransferase (PAPS reductase)/FAD synthetase